MRNVASGRAGARPPPWTLWAATLRRGINPRPTGRGSAGSTKLRLIGEVHEAGAALHEQQGHHAGRAIAVLGDVEVRNALALRLLVVDVLAVDEEDHVCVLLDAAAVPQVG